MTTNSQKPIQIARNTEDDLNADSALGAEMGGRIVYVFIMLEG